MHYYLQILNFLLLLFLLKITVSIFNGMTEAEICKLIYSPLTIFPPLLSHESRFHHLFPIAFFLFTFGKLVKLDKFSSLILLAAQA